MTNSPPASTSRAPSGSTASDFAVRELMAVREIVRAFLTTERPDEVFRFALEKVSPLVGASFASVFLIDPSSDLMSLAAAYNWPERYRPWLGEMKVRLGSGPSGRAASTRRPIEIPDVYADPALADWRDVAAELEFRALVALPLQTATSVLGAVTFYFRDAGGFSAEQRGMLRIVADQMAATAEKASLIAQLRTTNVALVESNAELERQYLAVLDARRVKDEFLANISHELRTPLTAVMGYISLMQEEVSGPITKEQADDLSAVQDASDRLLSLIDDLLELTTLRRGGLEVTVEAFDPREPLRVAAESARGKPSAVLLRVDEPEAALPAMRSDRRKIAKVLISLLSNAYKFTAAGEVSAGVVVRNGWVTYRVQDTGIGIATDAQRLVFDEFRQADGSATRQFGGTGLGLALSRRIVKLLGGEIELRSVAGQGTTVTVELPLEHDAQHDAQHDAHEDTLARPRVSQQTTKS